MSGISFAGMIELEEKINKALKDFPEKRRELHEKSGEIILKRVKANTPYDPDRKKGTHLRDAIYKKVGSEGGYVAVRPDYKKAPHAHLVEDGHVQKDKNGTPTGVFVKGAHMFKIGAQEAKAEILKMAEEFADKMAGELK